MGGFEGGIRVPALISYPDRNWTGGWRLKQTTSMMDVFPTILRQASINPKDYEFTRAGEPNDLGNNDTVVRKNDTKNRTGDKFLGKNRTGEKKSGRATHISGPSLYASLCTRKNDFLDLKQLQKKHHFFPVIPYRKLQKSVPLRNCTRNF